MPLIEQIVPSRRRARRGPRNRLVVALAYDGLCTFEFAIAVEVFGLPRPELGPRWYRFAVAGMERGPLAATGDIRVVASGGLELLDRAGTIIVPGWRRSAPPPRLVAALRRAHARRARVLSICSGAFLLAAAGLLDDRRATTHWRYADELARAYPRVEVVRDVLYVDEGCLLTSAGSAAGIDLCLYLIRRDYGAEVANKVARRLVVHAHRDGGQAQFIERPVPRDGDAGSMSRLLQRMRMRLAERMTIAGLAAEASMSRRTFIRRFKETTGLAPGAWLTRERMERARELLETSRASIDLVAEACGFAEAATLRHHFRRHLGVSPRVYRARFGA